MGGLRGKEMSGTEMSGTARAKLTGLRFTAGGADIQICLQPVFLAQYALLEDFYEVHPN